MKSENTITTNFIHYGSTKFETERFTPIKNRRRSSTTPLGGLWASPIDMENEWKQKDSFTFTLKPEARVFVVSTLDDIKFLQNKYPGGGFPFYMTYGWGDPIPSGWFNYERIAKNYDAIVYKSNETTEDLMGWECDCLLLINPDAADFH